MISSKSSGAVSTTIASFGAKLMTSFGTSEPANRHTLHVSIKRLPRTVMSSGSPGPAPIKWTVIDLSLDFQRNFANIPAV